MLPSPFGEKFHFRSPLSIEECYARIDALADVSIIGTNFGDAPVSCRQLGGGFRLHKNTVLEPPSLYAKLTSVRGWTEITGRGGTNFGSVVSAIVIFTALTAAGIYAISAENDRTGFGMVAIAPVAAGYAYWRFWQDSDAGGLIDYLQFYLDAEPIRAIRPSGR